MSNTIVQTWSGTDLTQLGPIYPMVGSEVTFFILGLIFWLGFHILQFRIEKEEFEADEAAARSREWLARAFDTQEDETAAHSKELLTRAFDKEAQE
ncbi:hypothetical protein [Nitratireductor sp. GCM10026969]|uniref:hypothetical protein n=1 Tax=Nitratireductor sp. GCM10026969 TaxID=3252645 RepID=UPI003618E64B